MNTAVYSGSFNPLHIGHLAILRRLTALYDKVMIVVSPVNPLKESATAADSERRLDAAREALGRHTELLPKTEVSDIEFHLPVPNYTVDTLDALKKAQPQDSFTLVVGGDQIADFRRWKDYRRILTEYGVAAFPREGFDSEAIRKDLLEENPSYEVTLIDMPLVKVSSTYIRKALADGEDISSLLM